MQRPGTHRGGADLLDRLPRGDHAADLRRDLEEFNEWQSSRVACKPALRAPRRLHVPGPAELALLRGADHGVKLFDRRFVAAMRTYAAHETLSCHTDQTGRHAERLRSEE